MSKALFTKSDYKKLIKEAARHDQLYYQHSTPEISDYDYDLLIKEIERIEKAHPEWVKKDSPSTSIATDSVGGFKTVIHNYPMLSLSNTYCEEEVEAFIDRVKKLSEKSDLAFNVELKMDGVALSLIYEDGLFMRAVTRGNGREGDDVTENARGIKNLPQKLIGEPLGILEFRAEVYLPLAEFERLNKERESQGQELYANPRNAASGSLKLLNPAESKKRGLEIVIYDLLNPPKNIHFQSEIAPYLKDFGLPVFINKWTQKAYSAQEILSFAHLVENMRSALPFQIDGVVIKLDDLDLRSSMGSTHKSPRWAVAYKFSPEQAETVIEKISIQVGRTGVLTPVAHLKPVLLSGSTISRATLHNQDEIDRKDIREGDQVIIEKGGDVIPKIVSVVINPQKVRGKKWHFPTTCPYCGSALVHNEGEVAIRCGAKQNCSGQYIARIKHFVSKGAMNIETFGVKVVEQLYEAKLLQSLTDIYRLKASDLNDLEGFGQKSIHLLLTHIETSKDCELYRFIFALGIPFVGVVAAKAISEKVKSIDQLLDVSYDDLIGIEGVGEKVAESILNYVQDKSNCEEIKTFMRLGISPREIVEKRKDHPFSGRQFVITGTLENYDRTEAKELIESLGGKVLSTLSKQTEYLLLGKNPGSKYKKALELNVKILTEEAFKGMV